MKRLAFVKSVLVSLAVLTSQPAIAADNAGDARAHLAPLERFLGGQWVVNGHWESGEELHARGVYEWGLNHNFIRAKTFVGDKDKEYQRYDGTFAWDAAHKRLVHISFAYNGSFSETVVEVKDPDTFQLGYVPYVEGQPSQVRQTLHFTGKDEFVWIVQLRSGDGWKKLIEATWHREPLPG